MAGKKDDHWVTQIRSRAPYRSVYEHDRPTQKRSSMDWKTVAAALLILLPVIAGIVIALRSIEPADPWADLLELKITNDEAFLYLLVRTSGSETPDWEGRAYRIAIDTYDADRGSTVLPPPYASSTASGVEFLVDLQGPDHSRLLVVEGYDPFDGEKAIFSAHNENPGFRPMSIQTNRERFGRDGTRFPSITLERGNLQFRDPDAQHGHTDVAVGHGILEIRIPWSLLNVTDPSSRTVLHSLESGRETIGVRRTEGFRIYAYSFRTNEEGEVELVDQIPSGAGAAPLYRWETWERPAYELQPKHGLNRVMEAMKELPDHPSPVPAGDSLTASE